MAKFEVTPELAGIIKAERTKRNITAKSIAEFIGKSQTYMSRLEKAEIKTIEESLLTQILNFIFGNEEGSQDALDSIIEKIGTAIELQFSDEEIQNQMWFDTYDTVRRKIPIPVELVNDLNERMARRGVSVEELCARINANEGILPQITNADHYPFNEWQALVENHKIVFYFIKVKVTTEEIRDVLSRAVVSSNYILLLSICYYLRKIELYGSKVILEEDENKKLNNEAANYLSSFRFYSISEKNRRSRMAKTEEERQDLLSSFDRENQMVIQRLLANIRIYSELDVETSNRTLSTLVSNLDWDIGFVMALLGMKLHELKDISFSNKKQMLVEMYEVFLKYKNMPEELKKIDTYQTEL